MGTDGGVGEEKGKDGIWDLQGQNRVLVKIIFSSSSVVPFLPTGGNTSFFVFPANRWAPTKRPDLKGLERPEKKLREPSAQFLLCTVSKENSVLTC